MTINQFSSLIIEKFGIDLYHKSLKFPSNKINLFYLRNEPFKVRSIIFDNDREYHLIIDTKKHEIFHDCPLFLIHSERDKKICVHLIRLLSILKFPHSNNILVNLDKYYFTSDDLGSKKKGKNFQLLANICFKNNNNVEALNYLNKAIINQYNNEIIVENYLKTAIENNLFIEFFEFLKYGFENDLESYITKYIKQVKIGLEKFVNLIPKISFYNLLKIIESINAIIELKGILFFQPFIEKLKKLTKNPDFNDYYFSVFIIKKNYSELVEFVPNIKEIIMEEQLNSLKDELVSYFFSEIDNFCLIDKLKLLKKQFKIIGIPKDIIRHEYKRYKTEIKELEKKLYLKKFAFLKLLIEKYNIIRTKGDFRKKRNAYIVKHDEENSKNPVYNYIIARIGFFGVNDQTIKSSEIGINYFIMNHLFLDDLSSLQDVNYYKTQFWGENDYVINSINGYSLLSKNIEYIYEGDQKYSDDTMIIEWDLANKAIQGSIVCAYGSQIVIPDRNSPLFHDLKPFDLCYCKRTPVKIESNIIKNVNVITKCSFKDAIKSVSHDMNFIEGHYPLSFVKTVLKKEINPFQAYEIVSNNPKKLFIPNYTQFIKAFREFLFNFIFREKNYIFDELKLDFPKNSNQILKLLNLMDDLDGLNLPYLEILEGIIVPNITLHDFRSKTLHKIHSFIVETLRNKELGSTGIFNLKKLKNTPFSKYSKEIIKIRKEEFESSVILKTINKEEIRYNFSEINKTYYGHKFVKILTVNADTPIKPEKFKKFSDFTQKLNLKIKLLEYKI